MTETIKHHHLSENKQTLKAHFNSEQNALIDNMLRV